MTLFCYDIGKGGSATSAGDSEVQAVSGSQALVRRDGVEATRSGPAVVVAPPPPLPTLTSRCAAVVVRILLSPLLIGGACGCGAADSREPAGRQDRRGPRPWAIVVEQHLSAFIPPPDEMLKHTFEVANDTGKPIRIAKLVPSCGCLRAQLDHWILEAGQRANLSITIDLRRRFGDQRLGCKVMADGEEQPRAYVLATKIYRDGDYGETDLSLGAIRSGVGVERVLTLNTYAKPPSAPRSIREVRATSTHLEARFKGGVVETLPDGILKRTSDLVLWLKPDTAPGRGASDVAVLMAGHDEPTSEVRVPVSWNVIRQFTVSPERAFFGSLSQANGTPVVRRVVVRHCDDGPFRILSLASADRAVLADIESGGIRTVIKLTLRPQMRTSSALVGQVVLQTDDPECGSITIPFSALP